MAAYWEVTAHSAYDMFSKYKYLIVSLVFPTSSTVNFYDEHSNAVLLRWFYLFNAVVYVPVTEWPH